MHNTTAKFATWVIRVKGPKVVGYQFTSRGETVNAQKFECVVVSKEPKEYMLGVVPFSFQNRDAAQQAFQRFPDSSVWKVTKSKFDARAKTEFISCPIKQVLFLADPTVLEAITDGEQLDYPALSVNVGASLATTMDKLKRARFPIGRPAPASGSAVSSRPVDVSGKIQSLGEQKDVTKAAKHMLVTEMTITDENAKAVVSVWDSAYDLVSGIPIGEGVALVGCTVTKDAMSGFKLNLWESGAHVLRGGERAQSLTSIAPAGDALPEVTASFVPTHVPISVEGEAFPSCAVALAEAPLGAAGSNDRIFQINRCILDAPTSTDALLTQDGERLFFRCSIYDWTGPALADVIEAAAPAVFGLNSATDVLTAARDGTLTPELRRVNVRGILRNENGTLKKYIAQIVPASLTATVSAKGMRATLGLAEVPGPVVQAAPVDRLIDCPVVGFALNTDHGEAVSAHRVLLLVRGTEETDLDPMDPACRSLTEQTYRVTSASARCLLSGPDTFVDLVGYCDFKSMLHHRLDKEVALVLASSLTTNASSHPCVTVEFMQKVSDASLSILQASLETEWKTALTRTSADNLDSHASPAKPEYWTESARKVRRVESECKSP